MKLKISILLTIAFSLTQAIFADVKLPSLISDHMVLQQNSKVTIWGTADPGEKVDVKADWQFLFGSSATADKDGNWQVKISTPKAGGPHEIAIKGKNTITLTDVLIGEVWICSGQSNMEWPLSRAENAKQHIEAANYPNIRHLTVPQTLASEPKTDFQAKWMPCSPDNIEEFSAVGYFFGLELYKELNVPIGLIDSTWGGTPAQAWTPADMLGAYPNYTTEVEELSKYKNDELTGNTTQAIEKWVDKINLIDPGLKESWQAKNFDDSEWESMEQPIGWSQTEYSDFDGIIWFRRVTNFPPTWAKVDMIMTLGPIDDIDTVYFNGQKIGQTMQYDKPREYKVPNAIINAGKNVVAVRVIDNQQEGGFTGVAADMTIRPAGASVDAAATLAGPRWKYKVSATLEDLPPVPGSSQTVNQNTASILYNGMISPLLNYTIKGAIWYQGEANVPDPYEYRTLFPNMIESWRTKWGNGDFPFYYVQIAPYQYGADNSAYLREAQTMSLSTPNTGMVVVSDIGNLTNIHPTNKVDVGKRLSLWALAKTYNKKGIVYSGPIYKSMKVEGNKIRIYFDHAGSGLMTKDGDLKLFTIAGEDKVFTPADAVIDGDTVVVSSGMVPEPVAVRFAFENMVEPNLFNKEGLPASSFRTDDWK